MLVIRPAVVFLGALGLAVVVPAVRAGAQNLVPQGTFDTGVQGWTPTFPFGTV